MINSTLRETVLASTTVRPGDVIVTEHGQFHLVGELFDTGAECATIFVWGAATLRSSRRFTYAELENMRVAQVVPSTHASRTETYPETAGFWQRYERELNLHAGVVTPIPVTA